MNETDKLAITSTGRTFSIKPYLTCKCENVLYAITCRGCHQQYIGMTTNTLAKRFTVHRQQIATKEYRQIGVSKHIDECSTHQPKFMVTPFYKFSGDKIKGEIKEQQFIKDFQPALNNVKL